MDDSLYYEAEIESLFQEIRERRNKIIELLKARPKPAMKSWELYDHSNTRRELADLFGENEDLIVIHNMGIRCSYCTMWADEINGVLGHLSRRAAIVMVNPDSIETQKAFAESRGWNIPMLTDRDHRFTHEMGFSNENDGKYSELPGYSTFHRSPDGSIERIGYDWFGPGDNYSSVWHFFELLKDGDSGWNPEFDYDPRKMASETLA